MTRISLAAALLLGAVLLPLPGRAEILEYVEEGGAVQHYRYTSRSGSVVFTDSLQKIPPEIRRAQKVVRRTVAGSGGGETRRRPAPLPAAAPAAETAVPALPEIPRQVEPPPDDGPSPAVLLGVGALAVAALAGGFVFLARRRAPAATASRHPRPGEPEAEGGDARAGIRRLVAAKDFRGAAKLSLSIGKEQEAALLFLQAKDPAAAAKVYATLGNHERAAACFREAGDAAGAARSHLEMKDYRGAAGLFEEAGEHARAAELWAALFEREGGAAAAEGPGLARRAAALFERAGRADRAVELLLKAGLHDEAAALCEKAGDFTRAAACHLKAGNLEKAVACIGRAADPRAGNALLVSHYRETGRLAEAAACAERAGDLIQAAEILLEAGEFSRAGALYLSAGFYDEAAESCLRGDDRAGAAEAWAAAGNHLQAARTLEEAGGDLARAAAWYEKGGDRYAAARLLVKLGRLDEALAELQQVDPAAGDHRRASLLAGMILLKQGMTGPAREIFERLVAGRPPARGNLDPWYFLALCHEAAGERARSREILEGILAVDAGFRDVRRRLG